MAWRQPPNDFEKFHPWILSGSRTSSPLPGHAPQSAMPKIQTKTVQSKHQLFYDNQSRTVTFASFLQRQQGKILNLVLITARQNSCRIMIIRFQKINQLWIRRSNFRLVMLRVNSTRHEDYLSFERSEWGWYSFAWYSGRGVLIIRVWSASGVKNEFPLNLYCAVV